MSKILILTLAFWTGLSNFAYTSARVECAGMMQPSAAVSKTPISDHSCCPSKVPCECSIRTAPLHQMPPAGVQLRFDRPEAEYFKAASEAIPSESFIFAKSPFESPPKAIPLYQIFSVYRL